MLFSNGINAPKENYGKGRKMISVMDILDEEPIKYEYIRNSVEVPEKIESKNKVENGDLVFVRSSEIPEEVGWAKAYLDEEYALYSGFSIRGKQKEKFDSKFVELALNSVNRSQIERKAGGSTRFNVSQTILNNLDILTPVVKEQNMIGSFFKQLEEIIVLHQRKLDLLKQLKQAYLQKLFPKKGEDRPEIRYTKFKENWKQRKFDDIVIRVNKSSNSDRLPKVEFEDIFAGEGSLNKDISKKFDTRKGIEFESEDILYGKLRPYLKNWLMPNFKGVALGDFWIFRVKSNIPSFVYSLIQADKFQKAANDTSGTKMPRSDWKKVSNTIFLIPENLEEQKKIGIFFKQLDDTIALHQKKLDQLKHLKSAFLQKMFI